MEHTSTATQTGAGRPSQKMILESVAEFYDSQFSVEDYCEYKGLNKEVFESWLSKHGKQKEVPAFVSVTLKDDDVFEPALFAEYKGIRFYRQPDVAFLKSLIS